jgi:asparagine synthase (glutamine-hydrolysing)
MDYTSFCYVFFFQEQGLVLPNEYSIFQSRSYFKGRSYSGNLLGNIYPYVAEYKNFDKNSIAEFDQNFSANPILFLKDFVGDFSFVYQQEDCVTLAARDHIGVFPLFYYQDDTMLVIGNDQRLFLEIPGIDLTPDADWMGEFVTSEHELEEHTFYKYIKEVPPSHLLRFENNKLTIERYWELDVTHQQKDKTEEEYIQQFNDLLVQAIEMRIPDGVQVGSEVSGGIDCTSIAAIAKKYLDKQQRPLFTYAHSAVDFKTFSSEREAIATYLTHLQPTKNTFVPRNLEGIRSIASHAFQLRNGVPHCHYALFSKDVYEAAKEDNVSVVFSGLGGDHGVSYRGMGYVMNDLARAGKYSKLYTELKYIHPRFSNRIMVLLKLGINNTLYKNARVVKDRLEKHKLRKCDAIKILKQDFPQLANYKIKADKSHLRSISTQEHLKERVRQAELSFRCSRTTIAASHFGVLYRYPLLDIRLLQYFVSLPSYMYFHKGINRYIFRQTIKKYVPSIAFQPKPPANMYGWILEAYMLDYQNNNEYEVTINDEEMRLYVTYWRLRDEQCYKGNDYFKDITKLVGYKEENTTE